MSGRNRARLHYSTRAAYFIFGIGTLLEYFLLTGLDDGSIDHTIGAVWTTWTTLAWFYHAVSARFMTVAMGGVFATAIVVFISKRSDFLAGTFDARVSLGTGIAIHFYTFPRAPSISFDTESVGSPQTGKCDNHGEVSGIHSFKMF